MSKTADTLADVIKARKTTKHFVDPATRHDRFAPMTEAEQASLNRMLAVAGQAPFHKPADEATHRSGPLDSPVPWRFHALQAESAVALVDWLEAQSETQAVPWTRAWTSKIPAMLSAAGAVVIVTWLPNPGSEDSPEFSNANIEHVAAAGAATQNLLLMAEAEGWDSYWSSGGALREPETFARLGIAPTEKLLGALMLNPRSRTTDKSMPGGLRDQRGDANTWSRQVTL